MVLSSKSLSIESLTEEESKEVYKSFLNLSDLCSKKVSYALEHHANTWRLFTDIQSCFREIDNFLNEWSYLHHTRGNTHSHHLVEMLFKHYINVTESWWKRELYDKHKSLKLLPLSQSQKKALGSFLFTLEDLGCLLNEKELKKVSLNRKKLSKLSLQFNSNVIQSAESRSFQLDGSFVANNKHLSRLIDKEGQVEISYSTYSLILRYSDNRELRHRAYKTFSDLATESEFDNTKIIPTIVSLKKQTNSILHPGASYTESAVKEDIVSNREKICHILETNLQNSQHKAQSFLKTISENYCTKDEIRPWDISYYHEIQKNNIYQGNAIKFTWDSVFKGLPFVIKSLLPISQLSDMKSGVLKHDRFYISFKKDSTQCKIIIDPFKRPNKSPGAFMIPYRDTSEEKVAALACNFDSVDTISTEDLKTILHELGHGLHHVLTSVEEYNISGINVDPTWIEAPSQMLEKVIGDCSLLKHLGEDVTENKLKGFSKLLDYDSIYESWIMYITSYRALIDLEIYHSDVKSYKDIDSIYWRYYDKYNLVPKYIGHNSLLPTFSHIFGGGYSSRYYTYVLSKMLADRIWDKYMHNSVIAQLLYSSGNLYSFVKELNSCIKFKNL